MIEIPDLSDLEYPSGLDQKQQHYQQSLQQGMEFNQNLSEEGYDDLNQLYSHGNGDEFENLDDDTHGTSNRFDMMHGQDPSPGFNFSNDQIINDQPASDLTDSTAQLNINSPPTELNQEYEMSADLSNISSIQRAEDNRDLSEDNIKLGSSMIGSSVQNDPNEIYQNTSGFKIGPRQSISSFKPPKTTIPNESEISLALSEGSQEVTAHVIEYNTAKALPIQKIQPDTVMKGNNQNSSFNDQIYPESHTSHNLIEVPNMIEPTNNFKLQDPPLFHHKGFIDLPSPLPEDNKFTLKSKPPTFSSPISNAPVKEHIEPSPQLPPPLSATSMQRLRFSNGEEFGTMRRDLATDLKSPAEYTLHIIFTQFVRHAERKLNLCIDYPLTEEPPIIDLLSEGVDPQFDKIVASLGYIARRKPKPVIDSVMFWRKNKSEIASLAASEVEKTLNHAKANLSRAQQPIDNSVGPNNPGIMKNSNVAGRGKRSLSLMRTKSFSKMSHRRNQSASSAVSNSITRSPSIEQVRLLYDNDFIKQKTFYDDQIVKARETAIQAERKSLASIYILCRVLIEVVKQTSPDIMGDDLGDKLEEIVYTQLKTTDPISTSESLVRSSNWNLFAELLGFMSEQRFLSVTDRFIADLEKIPSQVKQEDEPRLQLLIHGMRYLKLTNYPLEVFEESAEFIFSLAKFFIKSQNESIIYAYCEVLSNLVLPLANILTAETNYPTWVEAIEGIYNKASFIWNQMMKSSSNLSSSSTINLTSSNLSSSVPLNTNNGWAYSIHLLTSMLSVSRKELFSEAWFDIIENNVFKLKPKVDRGDKTTFIVCVTRLTWVYIYRLTDTLNNTVKKLDSLFDLIFFNPNVNGKKNQWITSEVDLISVLVEFIRIVGYRHLNYVLDSVLLRLLKQSFNGSTLENIYPEKIILVIKAYLVILEDYELGEKPVFPVDDVFNKRLLNDYVLNSDESHAHQKNKDDNKAEDSNQEKLRLNEFMLIAKNSTNAASHDEICKTFATLLKLLDSQCGSDAWSLESSNATTPVASSFSKSQSGFSFHFNLDFSYPSNQNLNIELFASLIEAVPWAIVPLSGEKRGAPTIGIQFKSVVELLTRNAVHSNYVIANASINALKKLAFRKNPSNLITIFAKIAFRFSDKPGPNYDADYLNSHEFNVLLKIYVDLLNCWLKQFNDLNDGKGNESGNPLAQDDEMMNNDILNDLYQINHKNGDLSNDDNIKSNFGPSEELEWKTIITVIEEVEGNGLFFLCSQDSKVRHYGVSILKLVEQFDQAIFNMTNGGNMKCKDASTKSHSRSSSKFAADIGTRLIHVFEDLDFLELIKPFRKELSMPERSRLAKLKNKKNILVKLAESDYGIDSTLWFRLYPKLLDIFFEKCPMPVAMCRSIVCVRMVQMHELIFEFSESYKNYTTSLFSRSSSNTPPEVLVNQWRLYLIFACCSLTSTSEQKISFPNQPTHGRKRSLQIFIQHQKITSAKSVFRMVLPLLKSQQPMVRDAVILGLSCLNINIFKPFLENLPAAMNDWDINSKKRDPTDDRLRIEIVHILSNITERFNSDPVIYSDDWMIANLVSIIKNVKSFLSNSVIQTDVEFQRLRRYFSCFLKNVFSGLQRKPSLNKWIPFEARIGCFNFLREWCGFGDSSEITEDRYTAMIKRVGQLKEAATAAAILEIEKTALQFSALSCMAVLCSGPMKQQIEVPGKLAVISFDIPALMNWIYSLLSSTNERAEEIGKQALKNVLILNINNSEVYQDIVKQCYSSHQSLKVTENYFTTFVDVFMEHRKMDEPPYDIFCLSTFLVGCDKYEVRFFAMKLLKFIELKFLNSLATDRFTESVCTKTKVVYKKALFDISAQIASIHPNSAFICISYLTMFFNLVDNGTRRDILACLLPWVQNVELKYKSSKTHEADSNAVKMTKQTTNDLDPPSIMVLNNLFEITVKFSSKISNEVEALWVALGSNPSNFDKIIEYITNNCLERKNALFVEYSRQIIDYLAFSQPDPLYIIDKLIGNLQPKTMVPPQPYLTSNTFNDSNIGDFPYVANLWTMIPYNDKDAAFSLGQLSMVFLVDLFTVENVKMIEKLPLLLHVAFSLLDHFLQVVQEQAGSLLIHLIHALAPNEPKSAETIDVLRQRDHYKYLWVYDDLNNDKKGARTPKNMDLLARNILEIFSPSVPSLQEEWSRVSLNWATTCAVRHIACRSFQLFRSLLSFLDQGMLKDMLHRLSNTISDEVLDIQGFAMQILMTLNAMTAELSSEKLIDFPQLFWSSVACLSTIHEQEFIEVLSTMSKFVSKIDLDSPETVSCLISTFPPKWEGKFEGLQHVVMVGLRSATAYEPTLRFLDKLNHLKDSEVIGKGDSRLLISVLANLPRFLHALDQKSITKDIEETAIVLSEMADSCDKPAISRILVSLSKNRFRSKKDFLVQTISTIKNGFFPEFEAQTLVLLLGFLSNKISWVKLETMSLLKHFFSLVDLQRDEFLGVGADLISPLLRLLLTDYAEPALEVLDEAVVISGSQLDRDVLRMSLGNSAMKKEYEKTRTLFGIPDESGWAIPMPAMTAASTRHNVHSVFSTCAVASTSEEFDENAQNKDEEFHFHLEDYYSPPADHGDTVSVSVEEHASLSNMWAALDDFDSFFTKESDQNGSVAINPLMLNGARRGDIQSHHIHSASVDTKYSTSSNDPIAPMDSAPQVYDKNASFILNRSLARTQSNTSFKSSLADSMGASNYASQGSNVPKRSYVPFRNSRATFKNKNETFTTPVMPVSPTFDPQNNPKQYINASLATPTLSSAFESSTPTMLSPENNPASPHNENGTRFEGLLSGKKKSKKANKYSPNASTSSIGQDVTSQYWSATNTAPLSTNMSTPTNSAQSVNLSTPKAGKKRSSQKSKQ